MKKIILITGASSGIGMASANALRSEGHIVYGASRTIKNIKNISFIPLEMDVTDDDSVKLGVEKIMQAEGRIDVLINNAGMAMAGPSSEMSIDAAKKAFDLIFFSVLRLSNAVLPGMIRNKSGLVINISSMLGLIAAPYVGYYAAAKFALEGYSQCLRMELQNTGVQLVLVNPGDFKTNVTASREKIPLLMSSENLKNEYASAIAIVEKNEISGFDPAVAGRLICKIVAQTHPAYRYLTGGFEQTTLTLFLKALLPARMFSKIINGYYGIK